MPFVIGSIIDDGYLDDEEIMDAGRPGTYDTAVSWLRDARDIYQQHNRLPEWQRYLDGILETHQCKYKLVPMLRNVAFVRFRGLFHELGLSEHADEVLAIKIFVLVFAATKLT
jgi:hypothetical protein